MKENSINAKTNFFTIYSPTAPMAHFSVAAAGMESGHKPDRSEEIA
jgi:hypothetical protein